MIVNQEDLCRTKVFPRRKTSRKGFPKFKIFVLTVTIMLLCIFGRHTMSLSLVPTKARRPNDAVHTLVSVDSKAYYNNRLSTFEEGQFGASGRLLTRLQFRNDDSADNHDWKEQHKKAISSSFNTTSRNWRKSLAVSSHARFTERERKNVDEYLTFLERRYNRLHADENVVPKKVGTFSALSWLFDSAKSSQQKEDQEEKNRLTSKRDDALFVFGMAGAAGQELLQKNENKGSKEGHNFSLETVFNGDDWSYEWKITSLKVQLYQLMVALHTKKQKLKNQCAGCVFRRTNFVLSKAVSILSRKIKNQLSSVYHGIQLRIRAMKNLQYLLGVCGFWRVLRRKDKEQNYLNVVQV